MERDPTTTVLSEKSGALVHSYFLERGGVLTVSLEGRLHAQNIGEIWRRSMEILERTEPRKLVVLAERVSYCDGAGIGLLLNQRMFQAERGREFVLLGLREEYRLMIDLFGVARIPDFQSDSFRFTNLPQQVGRLTVGVWDYYRQIIIYVGELFAALGQAVAQPGRVRWKDTLRAAEQVGVNALPIIALIGFLFGLILAFQSAIPLRRFGAEIYVADAISLSLLRELGPLMTAVILAGRSGSAFAAEIGTMQVNEEINALRTMGLDPVRFLVVPRVAATLLMTPLLTVFFNLLGLLGGALVLLSLGYPLIAYATHVVGAVDLMDFGIGMFKATVFGFLLSAIGCFHGLRTNFAASGVGQSATRAVVSGIIVLAVTDGLFAVFSFLLRI